MHICLVWSSRPSCGVCFPLCILCCRFCSFILRCMCSSLHLMLSVLLARLAVYVFLFVSCVVWSSRTSCGVCFPLCISSCLLFSRILRCMFSSLHHLLSGRLEHFAVYVFLFEVWYMVWDMVWYMVWNMVCYMIWYMMWSVSFGLEFIVVVRVRV